MILVRNLELCPEPCLAEAAGEVLGLPAFSRGIEFTDEEPNAEIKCKFWYRFVSILNKLNRALYPF